jgi:hypothetical protein
MKKINKGNSKNSQIDSTQNSIHKIISKSVIYNLSNENEENNFKNIDAPEELHFSYINVLKNGKEVEGKFEVSSSLNN